MMLIRWKIVHGVQEGIKEHKFKGWGYYGNNNMAENIIISCSLVLSRFPDTKNSQRDHPWPLDAPVIVILRMTNTIAASDTK